jgi:nitrite reductase/ring-hydroxylating ferredoxin subunit
MTLRAPSVVASGGVSGGEPVHVGTLEQLAGAGRLLVTIDGREVGVLLWEGQVYAYENRCLHQGGPVSEGMVIGAVETVIDDDGRVTGQRFDDSRPHLVCPWHGVEYELHSGVCVVDRRARLRRYEVEVRDGDVYVG